MHKKNKPLNDSFGDECFNAAKALLSDPASILTNIMASMGDGLSIQDRNMRIVFQNKFMIDNFGSHIGEYCYNIYEKRDSACEGCPIIESFRTGQVTKALRVGITSKGTPFRFENIASVLRNEQGEIVAGIELCRIVEEREKAFDQLKEAMDELTKTQHQLVQAEKLAGIGQLAAGVAHEINNPTSFILSNVSTMRDYITEFLRYIDSIEELVISAKQCGLNPQEFQKAMWLIFSSDGFQYLKDDLPVAIEETLQGLCRIKTIVSNLLAFASHGNSQQKLVDVNTEIESALSILANEMNNEGCIIKNFSILPETLANSEQLEQVFTSLIRNAIHAIKHDGIISITTEVKNNAISIEISDNGVGIPDEDIQHIYNPFFTTREVGSGVGLGLSIAYRIIEDHNGTIKVLSESGHGTTFTISLPITPLDDMST
ncbi:hypothetical protein JW859_14005 [bacterium]|nr:hypothetical protein [bacterium]